MSVIVKGMEMPVKDDQEKISGELEQLSEWEMEFYLYLLLPRLADKLEKEAEEKEPQSLYEAVGKERVLRTVEILRIVRELLVNELF